MLLAAAFWWGASISAQVPTDGLVAHYPLDGDTKDKSGAGNDGTGTAITPTPDRHGVANQAYLFNGSNSVISVPHAAVQGALPITVACWFKIDGPWIGESALVGKYVAGAWNGWQIGINPSSHLVPWYLVSPANTVIGNYGNPPFFGGGNLDASWHHAVFTVDAATGGRLYLDGVLVSQRDWVGTAGPSSTSAPLRIGQYVGSFKGAIDDVRIYNRVLSAAEVVQFYQAQAPVVPVFTSQPRTVWINPGDPVKFSATVTGATSYQWHRFLKETGQTVMTGATAAELNLASAPLNTNSSGYYVLLARNASGLAWSDYVYTLFITRQPASVTVTVGDNARFSVEVSDFLPGQQFQWRRNGVAIVGATAKTYTTLPAMGVDSGAVFDVEFSRWQGGVLSTGLSAQAVLTVSTTPVVPTVTVAQASTGYVAGGTATIAVSIAYSGPLAALGYRAVIPNGWSYAGGGNEPSVKPASGTTGALEWAWTAVGESPLTFTFTVNVPSGVTEVQSITGTANVRGMGGVSAINVVAAPDPLNLAAVVIRPIHSADTNRDLIINLTELTRVIELFNHRTGTARTGQYREQTGTEDGYATGAGSIGSHHSADANRDNAISLTELTRVIELFNFRAGNLRTGQYRVQVGSEDGFAPGP